MNKRKQDRSSGRYASTRKICDSVNPAPDFKRIGITRPDSAEDKNIKHSFSEVKRQTERHWFKELLAWHPTNA
jgi:hypothetical protein